MPRGILVVQSAPVDPSREEDYNAFYGEVHLPELRQIPGVVRATRYRLSQVQQPNADRSYPYLAVYELEADDFSTVFDEMRRRAAEGILSTSDAILRDPPPRSSFYEAID
jgi:hypothetical protein